MAQNSSVKKKLLHEEARLKTTISAIGNTFFLVYMTLVKVNHAILLLS